MEFLSLNFLPLNYCVLKENEIEMHFQYHQCTLEQFVNNYLPLEHPLFISKINAPPPPLLYLGVMLAKELETVMSKSIK